jgi:hypothetical protein
MSGTVRGNCRRLASGVVIAGLALVGLASGCNPSNHFPATTKGFVSAACRDWAAWYRGYDPSTWDGSRITPQNGVVQRIEPGVVGDAQYAVLYSGMAAMRDQRWLVLSGSIAQDVEADYAHPSAHIEDVAKIRQQCANPGQPPGA